MKRVLIATTLSVVAATLVGVAWAAGSGGAADAKPTLRLVDASPITVRGVNFEPGERISLTAREARSQEREVRRLAAGSAGGFLVRFPDLDANACMGYTVTAVGSTGNRATLGRKPGLCPPPPPEG